MILAQGHGLRSAWSELQNHYARLDGAPTKLCPPAWRVHCGRAGSEDRAGRAAELRFRLCPRFSRSTLGKASVLPYTRKWHVKQRTGIAHRVTSNCRLTGVLQRKDAVWVACCTWLADRGSTPSWCDVGERLAFSDGPIKEWYK